MSRVRLGIAMTVVVGALLGVASPAGALPSDTCRAGGGLGDHENIAGTVDLVVDYWQATSTESDVCVRAQVAAPAEGALFELEGAGLLGVAPVVRTDQTDVSPCTQTVHESSTLGDKITMSPVGSNPVSICIQRPGMIKRIDVGTTGSVTPPRVCWTLDSNPTTRTCIP
jgi:hypothetical protein